MAIKKTSTENKTPVNLPTAKELTPSRKWFIKNYGTQFELDAEKRLNPSAPSLHKVTLYPSNFNWSAII